jgi:uncharacterized protein YceK
MKKVILLAILALTISACSRVITESKPKTVMVEELQLSKTKMRWNELYSNGHMPPADSQKMWCEEVFAMTACH